MNLLLSIIGQRRRAGFDPDAADYFSRIVAAGSTIPEANKSAVNAFIIGCKADGIWSAIKASCILAASDTLAGALVPLVGPAPTSFDFVAGDYSRTTGLKGDGSTKALRSNYLHNADGQNNRSAWAWMSVAGAISTHRYICDGSGATAGGSHLRADGAGNLTTRCSSSTISIVAASPPTGLFGISRSSSAAYTVRRGGSNSSVTDASSAPVTSFYTVFARGAASIPNAEFTTARIAAYGFGESLNLALLDARLTTLFSALT